MQASKVYRDVPKPIREKINCGPGYSASHFWHREEEVARDHRVPEKRPWSGCPAGFAPGQEQEAGDGICLPIIAGNLQLPGGPQAHSNPQAVPDVVPRWDRSTHRPKGWRAQTGKEEAQGIQRAE